MKKILATLLAIVTLSTAVNAADGYDFYDNQLGDWRVIGHTGSKDMNPSCYAETTWQDGSFLHLVKDLADGELYIYFQNLQWEIVDPEGEYSLRMNIHSRNSINGGDYRYYLRNKNTIVIPSLDVEDFIPSFVSGSHIQLVMPGDISNAEVPLDGSSQAVSLLAECIEKSEDVQLVIPPQTNIGPLSAPGKVNT